MRPLKWNIRDISALHENQRFDGTVMTGHAFQSLLNDDQVINLFTCVASRLAPSAAFWFKTRNPTARAWKHWTPKNTGNPIVLENGRTVQVTRDVLAVDGHCVTLSERYAFDDAKTMLSSQSDLRFLSLAAITTLAAQVVLRMKITSGNWDGAPLTDSSPEAILELVRS